ncbi:MAG: purine-nucleoside phosphorylase, partial [Acidimicrobiales bacterium]
MTTPHIEARDGAFARTVLMPGDPKRARHIATTLMDDAELVTAVRGIEGFTGSYQGKPVSVMASGMGIPSASIYATELFRFYGVEAIIRVGTSGAINPDLKLGDIVVGVGASTDSNVNRLRLDGSDFAALASFDLLRLADQMIRDSGLTAVFGNIFSSDSFYGERPGFLER